MAIGGKAAGMLSGLGVGAVAGVMLAALNPILPQVPPQDVVQVAPSSDRPTFEVTEAPEIDGEEPTQSATAESAPDTPQVADAETTPEVPDQPNRQTVGRVATDLGGQAEAQTGETELALALPGSDGGVSLPSQDVTGIDAVRPETAPQLDTASAEPLPSAAPEVATSLDAPTTEPAQETDLALLVQPDEAPAPQAVEDGPTLGGEDTPSVDTSTAPAPQPEEEVATQDAPADETPVEEEVAAVEEPALETESTQRSSGFRFPTIGGDSDDDSGTRRVGGFRSVDGSSGRRFPTIGGSDTAASGGSRLPSIGGSQDQEVEPSETAEAEPSGGALETNRLPFDGADKPLISVVVIDNGRVMPQLSALSGLGIPLAVAVPVDADGATETAQAYRDAGFEVLALAPRSVDLSLSGNQSEDQVEELLDRFFDIIPDAMGLIDRPVATIQKDRRLARYVVNRFAKTGHGILTYAGGLNSIPRLAAEQDVPQATIYRYLDASGESGDVIDRALNRAAFEAKSKGRVVVMSTPNITTLTRVADWLQTSRARDVALAPVSASLLAVN